MLKSLYLSLLLILQASFPAVSKHGPSGYSAAINNCRNCRFQYHSPSTTNYSNSSVTSIGSTHPNDSLNTGSSIDSNIPSDISSSTNLTDQSNTLAETEANSGTDSCNPSTGTQDDTSLESRSADTENTSNFDTANGSEI